MTRQLKTMFAEKPLWSMKELSARLGRENLPQIEEAIGRLLRAGRIKVMALPGSPMSEIDPGHPSPHSLAADVYFSAT